MTDAQNAALQAQLSESQTQANIAQAYNEKLKTIRQNLFKTAQLKEENKKLEAEIAKALADNAQKNQ